MLGLARDGAAEGLWLRAERQTAGKGRNGRQWVSPSGNLHASTLIRLRPGDPEATSLALVAGIALHDAAAHHAPLLDLMLKWPNDLLCNGAKLAGILLEREGDAVVAGFGVNLAHRPEAIGRPATSLASLGANAPPASAFVETLGDRLAHWLSVWRGAEQATIQRHWLDRAHPPGTRLSVHAGEDIVAGTFDGLDPSGALRLRVAEGDTRLIHAGDIFLL